MKQLRQHCRSIGVTAPSGPNAKQKSDHDKMAKMNGAAFDKMFAQHRVADHKKDIAVYQKASKKQDAAGQYAQVSLPTPAETFRRGSKNPKTKKVVCQNSSAFAMQRARRNYQLGASGLTTRQITRGRPGPPGVWTYPRTGPGHSKLIYGDQEAGS